MAIGFSPHRRPACGVVILLMCLVSGAPGSLPVSARTAQQPAALSDTAFWRLVTELSESSGVFPQQLMSNEDSAQFVMPALEDGVRPGGVYLGVGAELNFTYLAALRSDLAFIVDIRRDNLLEVLTYKALFEMSANRAEFVGRLFARKVPDAIGLDATSRALFDAIGSLAPDDAFFAETVRRVLDTLTMTHGFTLSTADRDAIARIMGAFRTAGPAGLKGYGDRTNPTYAEMMSATDLTGQEHGFLSSEERFSAVRALQRGNRIVPVVGDFAGGRALPGIARYLREQRAAVSVFYVSNVERYLWEQGDHGRQFYANVASLPLTESSTFVRSVTTDISERLGIPIPAGPARWRTFLVPIRDCLAAVGDGRIQSYRDLFVAK